MRCRSPFCTSDGGTSPTDEQHEEADPVDGSVDDTDPVDETDPIIDEDDIITTFHHLSLNEMD